MSGDISFKENPSRKSYIENKTLPLTYKGTLQQLGDMIIKKTNSENVSHKVGVLNVEFALKLRIYRSLKSLICLK